MLLLLGITFKIVVVASVLLGAVAYLIYVERKVAAYAQDRIGPNRAGRRVRYSVRPAAAARRRSQDASQGRGRADLRQQAALHAGALIAIIAALVAFAVIPFGPAWTGDGETSSFQIAPGVDIGILYIFAVSSLAVYGVILAGWSSNNKYSFIGALRSSAQLISYEIPLGLSIMGVVLAMSTLDLNAMINWQDHHVWGIVVSPVGFVIFLISSFAETNRLPFDLPESEQELVGGFHTEYSGMKFGMFFLGEYVHVINVSFMTVDPFFRRLGLAVCFEPGADRAFWSRWSNAA